MRQLSCLHALSREAQCTSSTPASWVAASAMLHTCGRSGRDGFSKAGRGAGCGSVCHLLHHCQQPRAAVCEAFVSKANGAHLLAAVQGCDDLGCCAAARPPQPGRHRLLSFRSGRQGLADGSAHCMRAQAQIGQVQDHRGGKCNAKLQPWCSIRKPLNQAGLEWETLPLPSSPCRSSRGCAWHNSSTADGSCCCRRR